MRLKYEPIKVKIEGLDFVNYIYYEESLLLKQLRFYPYVQLTAIGILMVLSYWALNYTRKSEQNKVWVGLAKETAHQLGTPLSGLMAWIELLKSNETSDAETIEEMEKDVFRLATVTERFSNIGSIPQLRHEEVVRCVRGIVEYLDKRSSDRITFVFHSQPAEIKTWINRSLFEWVIENLCKNAIDSIVMEGKIEVSLFVSNGWVVTEVKDTGKGMSKRVSKNVFNAGFTTKQRGWGLGLTLAKRIVEHYHKGKIYVKYSEPGKGTIFRVEIPMG